MQESIYKYIIPYPSAKCLSSFLSETLSSNSAEICSSPYCWSSNWRLRSNFTWFEPKVSCQWVLFLKIVPWKVAVAHTLLKESLKIIIHKIKILFFKLTVFVLLPVQNVGCHFFFFNLLSFEACCQAVTRIKISKVQCAFFPWEQNICISSVAALIWIWIGITGPWLSSLNWKPSCSKRSINDKNSHPGSD